MCVGVTGMSQQVSNPICQGAAGKVTLVTDLSLCALLPLYPSSPLSTCLFGSCTSSPSQSSLPRLVFILSLLCSFLSFRMVGDEDDEGALSDSDGHSGLAADDLASK